MKFTHFFSFWLRIKSIFLTTKLFASLSRKGFEYVITLIRLFLEYFFIHQVQFYLRVRSYCDGLGRSPPETMTSGERLRPVKGVVIFLSLDPSVLSPLVLLPVRPLKTFFFSIFFFFWMTVSDLTNQGSNHVSVMLWLTRTKGSKVPAKFRKREDNRRQREDTIREDTFLS